MLPKYWSGCQCQFQVNSEPSVTRVNGAFLPCQINLCRNTHISSNFCFYYFSEIPTKSHKDLAWKTYKFSSSVIFWYSIEFVDIELMSSVVSALNSVFMGRKSIILKRAMQMNHELWMLWFTTLNIIYTMSGQGGSTIAWNCRW